MGGHSIVGPLSRDYGNTIPIQYYVRAPKHTVLSVCTLAYSNRLYMLYIQHKMNITVNLAIIMDEFYISEMFCKRNSS